MNDSARGTPRRPPTTLTVVALVIAIAGLVAIASHGTPVWTPPRSDGASRADVLAIVAVVWGFGVVAAAAVTLIVHRTILARRPGAPPLRATLLRALPITTGVLAISSLLAIARSNPERATHSDSGSRNVGEASDRRGIPWGITDLRDPLVREGDGGAEEEGPEDVPPEPGARFPLLLVVIGAIATAAAGAAAWRWRRSRSGSPWEVPDDDGAVAPDHEGLHGALLGTIDAMLADPDPNTAIRGAYARLLERLDACGAGRMDHEAPLEHGHRVLGTVGVRSEPLRELIELFEVARFSTTRLTSAHRDRALQLLRTVAAGLRDTPAFLPGSGMPPVQAQP